MHTHIFSSLTGLDHARPLSQKFGDSPSTTPALSAHLPTNSRYMLADAENYSAPAEYAPANPIGKDKRPCLHRDSVLLLLLLCLCFAAPTYAAGNTSGWATVVETNPASPKKFLVVDKTRQQATVREHNSPLRTIGTYVCTTGKVKGDKQVEGDQKTPEGVYFVKRHINSGLNWDLYGGVAYTLDYPNPVDKIRHKTGHGIWVHGRGHKIIPRETQGCVALNNDDLAKVGESIQPGTPVIIARDIVDEGTQTTEERKISNALVEMTQQWIDDWANRSDNFFSHFNEEAYSKAHGSFARFKNNKQRLFKRFGWLISWTPKIHVVQGPGYWVTYFSQYYRAPNLTVQGQRRLYWQKDEQGELRIVGLAWSPRQMGLEKKFLKARREQFDSVITSWLKAWRNADVENYTDFYLPEAIQGKRSGLDAIRQHKQNIWRKAQPVDVSLTQIQYRVTANGVVLTAIQSYEDSQGYHDTGRKRIILRPVANSWRIASEDWSKIR